MNIKEYRRKAESLLRDAGVTVGGSDTNPSVTQVDAAAFGAARPEGDAWERALKILKDVSAEPAVRMTALQKLQAGTFLGAQFLLYRARYLKALREAALTGDGELRRSALDILANAKDEFARRLLTQSLEGLTPPIVPTAVALGLLARDDHGTAKVLARRIFAQDDSLDAREQAVRILASDPSSKSLLEEAMKNKSEFRQVRRASAVALRNLDPSMFAQTASLILDDENDFADIKASVAGAISRAGPASGSAPTTPSPRANLRKQPKGRMR